MTEQNATETDEKHTGIIMAELYDRYGRILLEKRSPVLREYLEKEVEKKEKADWYNMIQLLPTSYNQLRTCTLNYENLVNMYFARKSHKLQEWHSFCDWIRSLPYANVLILGEDPA